VGESSANEQEAAGAAAPHLRRARAAGVIHLMRVFMVPIAVLSGGRRRFAGSGLPPLRCGVTVVPGSCAPCS
jgi:hypothetical protein